MQGLITAEEILKRLCQSPVVEALEWREGGRRVRKGFLASACDQVWGTS